MSFISSKTVQLRPFANLVSRKFQRTLTTSKTGFQKISENPEAKTSKAAEEPTKKTAKRSKTPIGKICFLIAWFTVS